MVDADAIVVEKIKNHFICALYVSPKSYLALFIYRIHIFVHYSFTYSLTIRSRIRSCIRSYLFMLCKTKRFIYRANGDRIYAKKPYSADFDVTVGSIVSFAVIANKKLQSTHVHKIICVRHDLRWKDVVQNSAVYK